MCLGSHDIFPEVIAAVVRHYLNAGIDLLDGVHDDIPVESPEHSWSN